VTRRLPLLLGALAFASLAGTAEAGHAHFGGGAHFSGGAHWGGGGVHFAGSAHFGGGVHWASPRWGGYHYGGYRGYGWGFHGHIYVGGYPYWYYPNNYYYYPEYVPSYYGTTYYPVQPAAAPGVAAEVLVPPPPLPRFGIGVFAGGVSSDVDNSTNTQETDLGVLGRFRLTDGLLIEGELGKISYNVNGQDNVRVDRRLGGSLVYEIGARNSLAPYVLAGLGVQQASVDGNYNTTQDYGEVGVGLRLALSRHFHITFDVRAGTRSTVSQDKTAPANTLGTMVAPPASNSNSNEDYTRARLAAIFYF